ncbi:MAG: iron ABC transporter permease, partial [Desulfobacterales bacterium]|nr:iron ABC transporter permease [Desulfobacterales bacterium]
MRNRNSRLLENYNRHRFRKKLFVIALVPVVFLLIGSAVAFGSADISFLDVYRVIVARLLPFADLSVDSAHAGIVIWRLRLPRIIMGLLAGLALGSSGAVMQVVLRNPLADPYMLGISSAASFGASLAIVLGWGIVSGSYMVIGNAFVFSMLSSLLILLFSSRKNATPETMVLTGLALLFFFQAMTTIIQYFGDSEAVKSAVFWTVGDLGKANWDKITIAAPLVLVGLVLLIWKSGDLNIMNTGDASAKSLGINVQGTRIFTMIVSAIVGILPGVAVVGGSRHARCMQRGGRRQIVEKRVRRLLGLGGVLDLGRFLGPLRARPGPA